MFWIQKEKLIEFMQKLDNAIAVGHCFMRKKENCNIAICCSKQLLQIPSEEI